MEIGCYADQPRVDAFRDSHANANIERYRLIDLPCRRE
jgi:hypothetical protein